MAALIVEDKNCKKNLKIYKKVYQNYLKATQITRRESKSILNAVFVDKLLVMGVFIQLVYTGWTSSVKMPMGNRTVLFAS